MGEEDANHIGVSAVLKVSMIREWILQWKISHRDSTEWIFKRRPSDGEIAIKIRKAFGLDGE